MLLKQLEYFVAVVETGSFSEAAEQLYISQSAVSQQISALEKDLAIKLMDRKTRGFTITPAGDYFYRHSRTILEDIKKLRRETVRIASDDEQRLKIGYLRHYAGQELHEAVAEFSALYPDVDIDIVTGTHEELYDLLRHGEVNLVMSEQRRAFSDEYVNYHLVYSDCFAELSVRNELSGKDALTVDELAKTPCILVATKEQQRNEQEFYQNTLGIGGNFLFAESLEEARLMVIGNRGFLPLETLNHASQPSPTIKRMPLLKNGKQINRNYCVFWRKANSTYYTEEFAEILKHKYPTETE